MLRQVILPTLALFIALVAPGAPAQEVEHTPAPKIACDEPVYNFGDMENSRNVEHTFEIRNDGDLTLEISNVKPTCGCTVANISQRSIPPGETAKITARLSLRGRQGRQRKAINVRSNDPQTPTLMLYLEGNAVTEVNVNPRNIFFGRIGSRSVVTGAVELTIRSTNRVTITKLESHSEQLAVKNQIADEGRLYRVLINTVPPLPQGTLRSSVRIETDHPQYPAMDIVVSAFVVGDITFAPPVIDLVEQPDKRFTRYVLLRSESTDAFDVTEIETPDDSITATAQKTAPNAYRIVLLNIPAIRELDGKKLRVVTSIGEGKAFEVPFRVAAPQN